MIKIYIFILMFSLELFGANIDYASSLRERYDNLSKTMPQPINDFVSTFSLGLLSFPLLLLISAPMLAMLYIMYKTITKYLYQIKTK